MSGHRTIWAVLGGANIAFLIFLAASGSWLFDSSGAILIHDFVSPWAASVLARHNEAVLAYDWQYQTAFETRLVPGADARNLPFFYPPHTLFILYPFSYLDYVAATIAFLVASALFYAGVLNLVVRDRFEAACIAVSGGGALYCLWWGQLAFLTSALLVGGLALLNRSPVVAGLLFGCLTIKPQLGLIVAAALVLGRYWTTLLTAIVSALALGLAAEIAFGPGIWAAFIHSIAGSSAFLASGNLWFKMQSIYALLFPMSGGLIAALVHLAFASCAVAIWVWIWKSQASYPVKASAVISATYLTTPYLFTYDAVALTGAAAFLLSEPRRNWEKSVLVLACLLPGAWRLIYSGAVPMAAMLMLYVAARQVPPSGRQRLNPGTDEPLWRSQKNAKSILQS